MKLSVHEMEPCIDGPSVNGTQNLLFRRRPLSSSGAEGFVKTLKQTDNYQLLTKRFFLLVIRTPTTLVFGNFWYEVKIIIDIISQCLIFHSAYFFSKTLFDLVPVRK